MILYCKILKSTYIITFFSITFREVWEAQMEALFYVHVVDANAPSYAHFTSEQVIENAKKGRQTFFLWPMNAGTLLLL